MLQAAAGAELDIPVAERDERKEMKFLEFFIININDDALCVLLNNWKKT
jgi:hypothetical protein